MFVETFIKRPVLASVCSIIIFLAGLICIPLLPVEQYPQLAPSQITVTANYIGADAQTVEATVTSILEKSINGAKGMKYMTSSSGNDGTCTINVIFNSDRRIEDALLDVQTRVKQVEARLPAEVKAIGVTIDKNSTAMVLFYFLDSKNNEYDVKFLTNYTDRYIKDSLQRTNGVANVMIFGERIFAMRLWLDPFKLASKGLTASDVVNALSEQNIQVAAGQIGGAPNNNNQTIQMNIQVPGRLKNPDEFDDMVIKTNGNNIVRLKDVGRSELGAETYNTITNHNGKESIGIAIFQLPDANAISVSKQIKAKMVDIKKHLPPGMEVSLSIDTSSIVKESIHEVLLTLIGSILLVIAVIFVFLQNVRTTIIPSITIPVSLVGTFILLKLFGFSINTLTLFGLVLATGLVVDDAIIVVENIARFMYEKKMKPYDAAVEGMKEIFGAVLATSLVLITVFVPVAFFPGTTGKLYKQFALTIAFSIFFSAFVSVTLTPAMSAILLKNKPRKTLRIFEMFNTWLSNIIAKYKILLNNILNNRRKVFIGFYILLGLTLLLFKVVPQSFIPIEDQAYFMIMVQAPDGNSLNETKKIVEKVNTIIQKEEDIKGIFDFTGYSFNGIASNKAMMWVALKPNQERKSKEHSANSIVNRMNAEFAKIPDAIIVAFEPPAIEGIGTVGGFQFEVKDDASHTLEELGDVTQSIITESYKTPALTGLFTSYTANSPMIDLQVDKLKAKQMNISLKEIYDTLQVFMGSVYVNDFTYLNKSYRVYAQADKEFRASPDILGQLYVRNSEGGMVPLSNFITHKTIHSADTIYHYNLRRSTEITGSATSGTSMGQAVKEMEKLAEKILPQNFSYEWSGIVLEQQESGSLAGLIFALSLLFVFLILAAQYENVFAPAIILLAVPLAIFGAIFAQFVRGIDNDVFCQIGLVMLIGLASKNAILIVEFANQLQETGKNMREAIVEAAVIRFRPIMMTSFACILGLLPLVFATGVGATNRISMGTAVFGGMIVSTILNLFLIPILYITIMTLQKRLIALNTPETKERLLKIFKRK